MSATPAFETRQADGVIVKSTAWGRLAVVALLLIYFGLWLFLTPYGGMGHDAQAYAIQAIAELDPVPFANDIFLQYRSQEEFTVFPHVYASLIDWFGLETTAVVLVLLCHLLWYGFAYLLLRQLLGWRTALFSLGLLVTLSGTYGAFRVFHLAEPFLTARLPGEVLSLAALWLYTSERKAWSLIAVSLAMAIHPLMGFPVAAVLLCTEIARRTRWYVLPAVLILGVFIAVVGSFVLGGADPLMSERWLAVTRVRSSFLFTDYWRPIDWNDALVSLPTLALAAFSLRHAIVRPLTLSALGVATAGLALAAIASVWLPLELLVQGQPWRWVWIARLLAIGLLPGIVLALWSQGPIGRGCGFLIVAAWIFVTPVSAPTTLIEMLGTLFSTVALVLWLARKQLVRYERAVLAGGILLLAAVLLSSLVTLSLTTSVMVQEQHIESLGGWLATSLKMLTPATLIAMAACALTALPGRPWRTATLAAVASVLIVAALPSAWAEWTDRPWTGKPYEYFADWRERIPRQAEVLWYDNLRETWFLLERRSYMTRSQSGGIAFSEALAEEIVRRALVLEPYIDPNFWVVGSITGKMTQPNALSANIVEAICRDPELGFVVSQDDIGSAVASKAWPAPDERIYLYDCNDFRG